MVDHGVTKGYLGLELGLLESFAGIAGKIPEITQTREKQTLIRYILNGFSRVVFEKYGLIIEEEEANAFYRLQSELANISASQINKQLELGFRSIPWNREGVLQLMSEINSIMQNKVIDYPNTIRIRHKVLDFYKFCQQLISIGEDPRVAELKWKLAQHEGPKLEFKETMRWNKREKRIDKAINQATAKTIAGLMNSQGGDLFIGVDDDGNVRGLEPDLISFQIRDEKKSKDLFRQAFANIVSGMLGPNCYSFISSCDFEAIDNEQIFVVTVKPASEPVFCSYENKVEFYIRVVNTTVPLDIRGALEYYKMHWLVEKTTQAELSSHTLE